jgi:hypothetical protein
LNLSGSFDHVIPCDREALQQELATRGAKSALIVFLNVIHNFLRDRAFAPASECYAGDDSNVVGLRSACRVESFFRPSAQFREVNPWTAKI